MTCCCSTGRNTIRSEAPGARSRPVIRAGITADRPGSRPRPRGTHTIAIGLTGNPVPVGSRSGAIMHRNDQRRISAQTWLSSVNCK